MAATASGHGYWLVAADGGVFNFGDAGYYGGEAGKALDKPVVGVARTNSGHGYWLVAADGGVFAFGDAVFFGSSSGVGYPQPTGAIVPGPGDGGYWLLPIAAAVRPGVPADSGFSLAQQQWEQSDTVPAVYQSEMWMQAAAYLSLGQRTDGGDTSGYPAAIFELIQLASIPETDVTPAQSAEADTDVSALSVFFGRAIVKACCLGI
jgi:hypothetical protein